MKKRSLFLVFMASLVLMNACQKEYSFESGGASQGSLQDDGSGNCLPKTVAGAYVVGTTLIGTSNYIEVQVNVTQVGTYTIFTDTLNGMYFRATGVFTATGLVTVQLKGNGTPAAAGIHNFNVQYGSSSCIVAVTTVSSLAVFTLDGAPGGCLSSIAGTYAMGTPLNASNTVTINVTVTSVGAYTNTTTLSNGMIFSGSGIFTNTGSQTIVLTGSGTPVSTGPTNIPVTAGSSSCSFTITVGGGSTFTITCPSTVVNGTYTTGTALAASNTVTLSVNVTATGAYNISTTPINGMTFSATGTFSTTGTQAVTLTGTGTPTTAGTTTVSIVGSTCTFDVTVAPAAGGAVFTITCPSTVVNGTYTAGTALVASNTVTLSVNVTAAGAYSITTTPINGMTFAASGNFGSTGTQTVTLVGTGTPTAAGTTTVAIVGSTCTFNVTVLPASGGAAFTIVCASTVVNGTYTAGVALTAANTVTLTVNVTGTGTYNISTTPVNGMTFSASGSFATTGTQNVTLTGTGTPTASGSTTVSITGMACTFNVNVLPGAPSDYFPRTTNSNWSYEFDDDPLDSVFIKVIAATHTALGNTYNIFMATDGTGPFDTSGFYRKSGNDYYHYVDMSSYLGLDNIQRVEFIFLKDNQNAGFTWTTANYANTVSGTPITVRIKFTILQRDVPISITSSTGTVSYPNTIVVQEQYEADFGTGFQNLDDIIGFYKDYYSRDKGWIKDEYYDAAGATIPANKMNLRRFMVY